MNRLAVVVDQIARSFVRLTRASPRPRLFRGRVPPAARPGASPGGAAVHAAAALRRPRHASVGARRDTVVAGDWNFPAWQVGHAVAPAVCSRTAGAGAARKWAASLRRCWRAAIASCGSISRAMARAGAVRSPCRISCAPWRRSQSRTDRSRGDRPLARGGGARTCDAPRARLERVVFVSPPASMSEHAHNFARLLGITPAIREAMRRRLERRYGVRFDEIDRIDDLAQLRLPALFVHDSGDTEVPFEHALRLSGRMPRRG